MKVLLLAAGQSKRFWPLTEKSLFPVAGSCLLAEQLRRLKEGGCTDVTIVTGKHNIRAVKRLFPKVAVTLQKDLSLGMQGALLSALPRMKNGPVLVVSGNDVVEPAAYRTLIAAAKKKGVDGAILARKVKRYFPGGYLVAKGGWIRGIEEKPGAGNEPSRLVNIVAHVQNDPTALLRELRGARPGKDDGYERALTALFATKRYRAVPYEGLWQPVKYPWHLLDLLPLLLAGIRAPALDPSATVHPTAVLDGPVVLGPRVRVLPFACIRGPCVIGEGTIIGNNALVRGSSVGAHCVIGYATEVKDSVLGDHVWTHSSYIGDSVIDRNVSFGAGSVTGNLRLDEGEILSAVAAGRVATGRTKFGCVVGADTRIGIHVSMNPGVKIGPGTFVSSACLLEEDLPDRSFTRMKGGKLVIRKNTAEAPDPAARERYRKGV